MVSVVGKVEVGALDSRKDDNKSSRDHYGDDTATENAIGDDGECLVDNHVAENQGREEQVRVGTKHTGLVIGGGWV